MEDLGDAAGPAWSCPSGFLTPGEMVGYLCTLEKPDEDLPPAIAHHIANCPDCEANWAYLKSTNPKVRLKREKDVAFLIRQVVAREKPIQSGSGERISSEGRPAAIEQLSRTLNPPRDILPKELIEILNQPDGIAPKRVVQLCDGVRSIREDVDRYHQAWRLAGVFIQRVDRDTAKNTSRYQEFYTRLKSSAEELIELEGWQVEVVASHPETSYFSDAALLVSDRGRFHFKLRKWRDLRTTFDTVTKLYGPVTHES